MAKSIETVRPEILSDSKLKFIDCVDFLAIDQDSQYSETVRRSKYLFAPGLYLDISVMIIDSGALDSVPYLAYDVTVCSEPGDPDTKLELMNIGLNGRIYYSVGSGAEPFGENVPDEAIESFLKRYNLTNE